AGERIDHLPPYDVVRRGIVQVFEGRRVFEHLTTEENLIAGGHVQRDRARLREGIERVYQYLPRLADRRHVQSGYLSGGEQQMLVIGRALMSSPRVILLDEPSLGLAPMLVEEIFEIVQRMNRQEKLTVLLVEQNATLALAIAEHGYVMENGRIVLEGSAASLRDNADIKEFYLGLTEVGARKSYRAFKSLPAAKVGPLKSNIADFICENTGGPCSYVGRTLTESHKGLGLAREDFDACNAALAKALDTNGVKAADKEQLMKLVQSLMP